MKLDVLGFWGVGTVGETTCFMVSEGETRVLIDASPNLTRQLYKTDVPMTDISGICLSHVHADHLQGLPYALFTRSVQARGADNVQPLQIFGNEYTLDNAQQAVKAFYPNREFDVSWETVDDGEAFEIGSLTIETITVDHPVPTNAYRFTNRSGDVITFSGDTLPIDEMYKFADGSDLLIQEAFGTEEDYGHINEELGHSLAVHAGEIADELDIPKMVIFHMHERYAQEANKTALLDEIRDNYAGDVVFPEELMQMEI